MRSGEDKYRKWIISASGEEHRCDVYDDVRVVYGMDRTMYTAVAVEWT